MEMGKAGMDLPKGSENMGLLPKDADILPPTDDRLFKALLISPEAKPVLMDLISAIIGRSVIDVVVLNNELPVSSTKEKNERLDVNCKIDDGSQVDLEMQASYIQELGSEHENLKGKSIYYLCDLHASQDARSKRYDELVQTYQVTFCSYTVFPELPNYLNPFSMRHDATNVLLSDAIHVIYVELSKLGKVLKKPVDDMTDLEKWSVFLKYSNDRRYRKTVNSVIESKEALQMASNLLMNISQNERERAIFRSRKMYQTDEDSNRATLIAKGKEEKAFEIAREMLLDGEPVEKIIKYTRRTHEEVEDVKKQLFQ